MPLPRRSLRERLPPDVAASIEYPPAAAAARVFPYLPNTPPRTGSAEEGSRKIFSGVGKLDGQPRHADAPGQRPGSRSAQAESVQSRAAASTSTTSRLPTPQPSVSTASSTDGQDVLECNNKKKRKIPTASDAILHNGLGENASSGPTNIITPVASIHSNITTNDTSMAGYTGPGTYTNMGMSGSGRGTLGVSRSRTTRNPLRDIQSGNAAWGFRTGGRLASGQSNGDKRPMGIISNAIANANKSQQGTDTSGQMTSEFSFRCKSQVPGGSLLDPPEVARPAPQPAAANADMPKDHQTHAAPPAPDPAEVERQNRRRLTREYAQAARARKQRQRQENLHNPPKPEDMWICEFCEYEALFKEPPRGLIRMYEMRDRKVKDQEAERRRLLDKAKIKRKKNKKAPKNSTGQTTQQQPGAAAAAQPGGGSAPTGSNGGGGGESGGQTGDGWDGGHNSHSGGHLGKGHHGHHHEEPESDIADMDSDEGPPDLFREYAHPIVAPPASNGGMRPG